jgi:DNA-binding IclR family transcriptional regulator
MSDVDMEAVRAYLDDPEFRERVRESCIAQGVPETITDPETLRQIAALFRAAPRHAPKSPG